MRFGTILLLVAFLTSCAVINDPKVQRKCIETVCDIIQHRL